MKKYRSLWYKSTTNHNILYFSNISSIQPLNTGILLWKVGNSLVQRGFRGQFLTQILCIRGPERRLTLASPAVSGFNLKPSPPGAPTQDAKPVQFALIPVRVVDK
jgi:hypothetical protein